MDITRELAKYGYKLAESLMEARKPSFAQNPLHSGEELSFSMEFPYRGERDGYRPITLGADPEADVVDPRFEPYGRILLGREKGKGYYVTEWPSSPYEVAKKYGFAESSSRRHFGRVGEVLLRLKKGRSAITITAPGKEADEVLSPFVLG